MSSSSKYHKSSANGIDDPFSYEKNANTVSTPASNVLDTPTGSPSGPMSDATTKSVITAGSSVAFTHLDRLRPSPTPHRSTPPANTRRPGTRPAPRSRPGTSPPTPDPSVVRRRLSSSTNSPSMYHRSSSAVSVVSPLEVETCTQSTSPRSRTTSTAPAVHRSEKRHPRTPNWKSAPAPSRGFPPPLITSPRCAASINGSASASGRKWAIDPPSSKFPCVGIPNHAAPHRPPPPRHCSRTKSSYPS